jgi:hypothetical protein
LADENEINFEPRAAAAYITDMIVGLRDVAKGSQLDFLVYLLEMTYDEANSYLKETASKGGKNGK